MNTQIFYRRVEIIKCLLLSSIVVLLALIYLNLPRPITVQDIKERSASLNELPVVIIKDGRVTIENEEIKIRGTVTLDGQPIEVTQQNNYHW